MHGDNEAKRKIQEEIKKRKSKFVALGSAGLGLFIPIALFLFVITVFFYLYESYIISSTAGEKTIFQDDKMVSDLEKMFELHEYGDLDDDGLIDVYYKDEVAADNSFVQELKRQQLMWADDYSQFGISNEGIPIQYTTVPNFADNDDDLDLEKFITLINYQSYLNLGSFYTNYNDDYDNMIVHDDVPLNEYENERVANNRDVRNFYEKAKDKVGNAFFLYPGMRKLVGNSIDANLVFDAIHPAYWCTEDSDTCVLTNLTAILSDWEIVGKMYMQNEIEYNKYFEDHTDLGPMASAQYLTDALSFGYNVCTMRKKGLIDYDDIWTYYNICNDYDLIYSDTFDYVRSLSGYENASVGTLEEAINDHLIYDRYAEIPMYEIDEYGGLSTNIKLAVLKKDVKEESQRLFITTNMKRLYDEELYEDYLKKTYIPAVYTECKGCNKNKSVDSVYSEIRQYEEAYRYFNKQNYKDGQASSKGNLDVSWSSKINYTCSGSYIGISGDYDNHHGTDLTSSQANAPVFPLMTGEVVSVTNGCGSYANRCSSSYTLQYKNASGQLVSDAVAYTYNTGLFLSLPSVCLCGGGLGNSVTIHSKYNGRDIYIRYGHMDSVNVTEGSIITPTTIIGRVGNTGISTGPHLHIDVSFDEFTREKPTKYFSVADIKGTLCSRDGSV